MKATQGTTYRGLQSQIMQMGVKLEDLRMMAASGKKFNKSSDNPAAIRPVLNARTQLLTSDRYLTTMGHALDKMESTDGYLGNVEDILQRVRELALNGMNSAMNQQDLDSLADQVGYLKEQLVDTANTKVDGKYVFAGFNEDVQPFIDNPSYDPVLDPRPVIYTGDANAINLEVAPGQMVQVNLNGNALFLGDKDNDGVTDAGGADIFATLTQIEDALRAGDISGIEAQLTPLETGADQVRSWRGFLGNNAERVETGMLQMEDTKIDLKQTLSRYEDADVIETLTMLSQQETAFQAALNVTAKVSELSILNYL